MGPDLRVDLDRKKYPSFDRHELPMDEISMYMVSVNGPYILCIYFLCINMYIYIYTYCKVSYYYKQFQKTCQWSGHATKSHFSAAWNPAWRPFQCSVSAFGKMASHVPAILLAISTQLSTSKPPPSQMGRDLIFSHPDTVTLFCQKKFASCFRALWMVAGCFGSSEICGWSKIDKSKAERNSLEKPRPKDD